MRELLSAMMRLFYATSLFGVRRAACALLGGTASSAEGFRQVASAALGDLTGPIRGLRDAGTESGISRTVTSSHRATRDASPTLRPPNAGRLDIAKFVVLGEGLAAGMGDFALSSDTQIHSFTAQMAKQMGVAHLQRLIEPPGIGNAPGFAQLPVIVPSPFQEMVVDQIPPQQPHNLAVPGYTVGDCIRMRATQPLVNKEDSKQTLANFVLGLLDIAYGKGGELGTQLEYAIRSQPTFVLVALGFSEVLEAAISERLATAPSVESFQRDYSVILHELRESKAEVLALNVPDPFDTAYFSSIDQAVDIVKVEAAVLRELWHLEPETFVTVNGLNEIAYQILAGRIGPLPSGSVVSADLASQVRQRVSEFNDAILQTAQSTGSVLYNLNSFFHRIHETGALVGNRRISGQYLCGFYRLNGYFPGAVGHGLIANEILQCLNSHYGSDFEPLDVAALLSSDPVTRYKLAAGPNWTAAALRGSVAEGRGSNPKTTEVTENSSAQRRPERTSETQPTRGRLILPPGLEQVLPVNKGQSYFGDGISALNCSTPQAVRLGSEGSFLFGGLAMVDSHLSGHIRIKFSPPVNGNTRFQVFFEGGFTGEDEVLQAPRYFKMPFLRNRVDEVPGMISSGTLNLETGEVDTSKDSLSIFALYRSTALNALISVNPTFPSPPKQPLSFPGPYGSACVRFEQRRDGLLDFIFVGSTFVPLGDGIVWPLNFTGPSLQFATIPANGTVMHPHLALSTRESEPSESTDNLDIAFNTLQEYSLFAPISSFGDVFTLNARQLGGPATGRSRLLGRVQIQFGPRCGNSVPVAVSTTTPGGTLAPLDSTPLTALFPGRLTPGPLGFYENLRFPLRTYSLNDLSIIDDPFDLSIGSLDLRTGNFAHPLLHRGFINQDLIFALIRVEPRTPQNSFMFRGPAEFKKRRGALPTFQFYGQVHIPYPPGFLFPDQNLATGFRIGNDSALDPYLWLWAMQDAKVPDTVVRGSGEAISSRFEKFRYRYEIPTKPGKPKPVFEYENLSQNGKFRLHSLAWVGFANSNTGSPTELGFDTLTFTGFGVWSKNGIEMVDQVSVQVIMSDKAHYIGIQVGLADVSNANTAISPDLFPLREPEAGGYDCCVGFPSQPPSQPSR